MQLFVGELPSNFPNELIPEHSRVVGGMIGYSTVAVFDVPDPIGAASAVERQARAAGWTAFHYRPDGFQPDEPSVKDGPLCRDSRSLNVLPVFGPDSLLRIDLSDNPNCAGQFVAPESQEVPMPVLRAPPGTLISGFGSGGGLSYETRSATIRSERAADELAEYFSEQARRQGWRPTPVTGTEELGIWTFERGEDNGGRLVGLLVVHRFREGEYFAQFQAGSSRGSFWITVDPTTKQPAAPR